MSVYGKIRNSAGETITETLVSVLIIALAAMMVAGGVTASSRIILKAEKTAKEFMEGNDKLIIKDNEPSEMHVEITDGDGIDMKFKADAYVNDTIKAKEVVFFVAHPEESGTEDPDAGPAGP